MTIPEQFMNFPCPFRYFPFFFLALSTRVNAMKYPVCVSPNCIVSNLTFGLWQFHINLEITLSQALSCFSGISRSSECNMYRRRIFIVSICELRSNGRTTHPPISYLMSYSTSVQLVLSVPLFLKWPWGRFFFFFWTPIQVAFLSFHFGWVVIYC